MQCPYKRPVLLILFLDASLWPASFLGKNDHTKAKLTAQRLTFGYF